MLENEQVAVDDLGYRDDGISHVIARVGFQDEIDVPRMLALAVLVASKATATSTVRRTSSRA